MLGVILRVVFIDAVVSETTPAPTVQALRVGETQQLESWHSVPGTGTA